MGVIMSKKEEKDYNLAYEVLLGKLSIKEFCLLICKSYRQSRRIIKRVRQYGMYGIKHGNTGKRPVNKTEEEIKKSVQVLIKTKYYDFNITHLREKLAEDEGFFISKETLRSWCHEIKIVKHEKRRTKKIHKPRPRMPKEGQLIQFDGSEHRWFEDRGPICTLIGGIDDATSKISYLEFFSSEDSLNCMKTMKEMIILNGVPVAFYLDQAQAFGKIGQEQGNTQIGRALKELNCSLIFASSPQAKGRIERLWGTLQDRLIAELRLNNISNMQPANEFLIKNFIPSFNLKFSIPARDKELAYKPTYHNLDDVFAIKEKRKITNANTFSWNAEMYQIEGLKSYRFGIINILTHIDERISFQILGKDVIVSKLNDTMDLAA
jgi:transposase